VARLKIGIFGIGEDGWFCGPWQRQGAAQDFLTIKSLQFEFLGILPLSKDSEHLNMLIVNLIIEIVVSIEDAPSDILFGAEKGV
jgi:hypothetical protein